MELFKFKESNSIAGISISNLKKILNGTNKDTYSVYDNQYNSVILRSKEDTKDTKCLKCIASYYKKIDSNKKKKSYNLNNLNGYTCMLIKTDYLNVSSPIALGYGCTQCHLKAIKEYEEGRLKLI